MRKVKKVQKRKKSKEVKKSFGAYYLTLIALAIFLVVLVAELQQRVYQSPIDAGEDKIYGQTNTIMFVLIAILAAAIIFVIIYMIVEYRKADDSDKLNGVSVEVR